MSMHLGNGLPLSPLLAALLGAGSVGAQPVHAAETAPPNATLDTTAPADTNRLALVDAMARGLATHPSLRHLLAEAGLRAGDAASLRFLRSPEIRGGYGRSETRERGFNQRNESGTETEIGTAGSSGTTRQFGVPLDTREQTETSRREAQSQSTRQGYDDARDSEWEWELGLRLYPPNPWLSRSQQDAAQASHLLSRARLWEETHGLACQMVEAGVRLQYASRMLGRQRQLARDGEALLVRVRDAAARGYLAAEDEWDANARVSGLLADVQRLAQEQADQRAEFRRLTGVDPARVDYSVLRPGNVLRLPPLPPAGETRARQLAKRRADVLMAHADQARADAAWHEAQARRYPWITHADIAYSEWERDDESWGRFDESGRSTETIARSSSEVRPSTFEVQDQVGTELREGRSRSTGTESGASRGTGSSWWIGAGVDVPIFEWVSREHHVRRATLSETRQSVQDVLAWAEADIRLAAAAVHEARRRHAAMREDHDRFQAAAPPAPEGDADLPRALSGLRLRQSLLDYELRVLDLEMRSVLAELDFCRAAGLVPFAPVQPPA